MKKIVILGATGSVGSSTLDVVRENPDRFRVVGLAAGSGSDRLVGLAAEFPDAAIAVPGDDAIAFDDQLEKTGWRGEFYSGRHAAAEMVRETSADTCVAAVGGIAGIEPTFAAAERGLRILLANKEVLVSAGRLFMDAVRAGGARVLPLDSEHSALFQCLQARDMSEVDKLIITASGGPFRTWTQERMTEATPGDAVRHPVWRMGAKISVDSATMANKVLEVIEAHHLFDVSVDKMEVLVHPQSIVHGMVEFIDGTVLSHMGITDMRQPISYMLFYPKRQRNHLPRLDLTAVGRLEFEKPDPHRFPMLEIGLEAALRGGRYPAIFNAANETAVELFLAERIKFTDIALAVARAMDLDGRGGFSNLEEVMEVHGLARDAVMEFSRGR